MPSLKQQIEIKQAMVIEDRQLLAADAAALRARTKQALTSPKTLAGGFGLGFVLALVSGGGRSRRGDSGTEPSGIAGRMLPMLLRDVVMPIALNVVHAKFGIDPAEQDQNQNG